MRAWGIAGRVGWRRSCRERQVQSFYGRIRKATTSVSVSVSVTAQGEAIDTRAGLAGSAAPATASTTGQTHRGGEAAGDGVDHVG